MKAELQHKEPQQAEPIQSKRERSKLSFVDNRPQTASQTKLLKSIQKKSKHISSEIVQLKSILEQKYPKYTFCPFGDSSKPLIYFHMAREQYWEMPNTVFEQWSIKQVIDLLKNAKDETANKEIVGKINELLEFWKITVNYDYIKSDDINTLRVMTDFVKALDDFLDKYEDEYSEKEKSEKIRLAEILVRYTPSSNFGIYPHGDSAIWIQEYKDKLYEKTINNPRLVQTLRGKESLKLHLRDDNPDEIRDAINKAVDAKKGSNEKLKVKEKTSKDTEWNEWRKNDCVFAAILYVMKNNEIQNNTSLGLSPMSIADENDEYTAEKTIADKLGVNYNILEDPILFSIMESLHWVYISNKTWNSWVGEKEYDSAKTYIISYAAGTDGTSYHTVVFQNGDIYDRQGKRLYNKDNGKPAVAVRDHPMDIWVADKETAKEILDQFA